jgi:hypothetical protein
VDQPNQPIAESPRQEFELAIGKGLALADLSSECVRAIRNAVPFDPHPRLELLSALATMPDEAFSWLVVALQPAAMTHGATAQLWPDGIGGFTSASRESITAVRTAAAAYLDLKRRP